MVKKLISLVIGNVMREVEEIDQTTETRVVKSHLPLYLLNPKLLDTSKVSINMTHVNHSILIL